MVELEHARIQRQPGFNLRQRHAGFPPLRIQNRPLAQFQRFRLEHQSQGAFARVAGAEQGNAQKPAIALDAADGDIPGKPDFRAQQHPKRGGAGG